ncbi:MAG: MauE/DoxX family redox-associated membrane protein [Candidatus Peribacteraceae bacterium]
MDNPATTLAPSSFSLWQYRPLFTIVGLIALASIVTSVDGSTVDWMGAMTAFMAGFFLVFAGFKLLDVPGFARGYAKYDLLAMRWKGYGYLYPFIELVLGIGYLTVPLDPTLNMITAAVMLFGGIGVTIKLLKREQFQCACLGTFIKVPLTAITFIEDFGMALMALGLFFGMM